MGHFWGARGPGFFDFDWRWSLFHQHFIDARQKNESETLNTPLASKKSPAPCCEPASRVF
jgi:hypothetical protein